jgi:hypothetical protein
VLRGHIYEIGSQGRICRCGFRPSARPDLETLNALHTAHLAAVAEQWFTDRLAPLEALADKWEREAAAPGGHDLLRQTYKHHAADLRAVLGGER